LLLCNGYALGWMPITRIVAFPVCNTIGRALFPRLTTPRRIILWKMPSLDNPRPNPEELLRRVQADERKESRGRLKVFLGYASRVGKSFRMFDEGRRRKERGQDAVSYTHLDVYKRQVWDGG